MPSENPPKSRTTRSHLALLKRLTEASAVSGDEAAVRAIVRTQVEAHADEMHLDAMGNLLVTRHGSGRGRMRVMLAAHMDEIGFMITAVEGDGSLRFASVGGIDARLLPGKRVWVGRERLPGVIGIKPIHLLSSREADQRLGVDALRIDIGASSKDAARSKVKPGARAAFATDFVSLGPTIRGKAFDDRLGVATLIELVRNPPPGVDLLAAFTVQEEILARGARAATFTPEPHLAIALDATPARDLPTWDGEENTAYNARLGHGPAIYVADRVTYAHPGLVKLLVDTAEAEGLPYQLRQPGLGATDAAAIQMSRHGIPSISLSVPVRYAHSPCGITSLSDWRATVRLIYAALTRLRASTLRR